jgi:TonB family protein
MFLTGENGSFVPVNSLKTAGRYHHSSHESIHFCPCLFNGIRPAALVAATQPNHAAVSLSPSAGTHRAASVPVAPPPDDYAPANNAPLFPGGPPALEAYLQTVEAYPMRAQVTDMEGTVRVRFRVLPTGRLSEVRIVQSHGPLLDPAALRLVLLMPRWYPAHQAGVAVACLVELSVRFCFE